MLKIVCALVVLLSISACQFDSGSSGSYTPPTPQPSTPPSLKQAEAGYIYVADRDLKEVYVVNASTEAVVKVVPEAAIDLAVDSQGNVYTSEWATDTVSKWSPGMGSILSVTPTVDHPSGITVDGNDDLWVTTNGVNRGSLLSAYHAGALLPYLQSAPPGGYSAISVAVDKSNQVYAEIFGGPYNFVARVDGQTWTNQWVSGAGPAGITFDARNQLTVCAAGYVAMYRLPDTHRKEWHYFGVGAQSYYAKQGQDGNLYVPIKTANSAYVYIWPTGNRTSQPHTLYLSGLSFPQAAVEGRI